MTLIHQQERFALGVASGRSQAEAYREAYPKSRAWKDPAVHSDASALAANPKVSLRVRELRRQITDIEIATARQALVEASRIALFDIRKAMNPDGTFKKPNELDADTAAAIASVKIKPNGEAEYKFWDKNTALEKLFRHHGLYEKDNDQKTDPLVEFLRGLSGSALPVQPPKQS